MKTKDITLCALCAGLLAVCAWISIPVLEIAFTLQTFAVFLTLGLLGGRRGTIAIAVYLVLGFVGLPVFTGFRGGPGVLLGVTGGYIVGFLFSGLFYWVFTKMLGERPWVQLTGMVLGMLLCYAFGSVWYYALYLQGGDAVTLGVILAKCVVPYILPDAVKIGLAFFLTQRLKRFI